MRYWYDWEFLENGSTIRPISIGIAAEDGRELYLVNEEIQEGDLNRDIVADHWLMENVVARLPLLRDRSRRDDGFIRLDGRTIGFTLDQHDNRVVGMRFLRNAVRDFLLAVPDEPVELWGYYSAYDHVRLMQLFGPMMNRPPRLPMRTNDVAQFADMLGVDEADLPAQDAAGLHNALDDARWTRDAWAYLDRIHTRGAPPAPLSYDAELFRVPEFARGPLFPDEPITMVRGGIRHPIGADLESAWASTAPPTPACDPNPEETP